MIPKENSDPLLYYRINYDFYLSEFNKSLEGGNDECDGYKVKSFLVN